MVGDYTPTYAQLTLLTDYENAVNRRKSVSSPNCVLSRPQLADNRVKVHGHLRAGVGRK